MGLLSSFTDSADIHKVIAADAPQFSDFIEPVVSVRVAGQTTTAAMAADTVYYYRFRVAEAITIANAQIYVAGTKAGSIDISIYTLSGTTLSRVAGTGNYDIATNGTINAVNTIPFASPASYNLAAGTDYFVAIGGTGNATLTILRGPSSAAAAAGTVGNMMLSKASVYSSGNPTSITSYNATGTVVPFYIALKT